MAIENNLPIILDTATQTEDGLMSYLDKIKLDGMEENLSDKLSKGEYINEDQIPGGIIKGSHLSQEVKDMMTGKTAVSANIGSKTVTTDKIDDNAVTIEKLNKTLLLGNVVAPKPINFTFDTKKVTINIPKGSLLMLDAVSERDLAPGSAENDITVNLNYPAKFEGLNYIVSAKPTGTATAGVLSLVNNSNAATVIPSTSSIVALVYITTKNETFQSASVVMHGAYTINGLAQGIGTESAALMGNGKIILDAETGVIDFTQATALYLITGGTLNKLIQNQASIRLGNYSIDATYVLYWNNESSALEVSLADINITNTDINKIALIKDGRIVPFVNTGIYYSKPKTTSGYYLERYENINIINLSSNNIININTTDHKVEFSEDTVICLNQTEIQVNNTECVYKDRVGLHYILFDLDDATISCRYYSDEQDTSKRYVVVGTLWVGAESILVFGNFKYTVNGKQPYEDDLYQAETDIKQLQDIIISDLDNNRILSTDEIYLIEDEELPVYESSMLIKTVEGIKSGIVYYKNNDIMSPRTTFFNNDILLNNENGNSISLIAYDKYNNHSYLKKDIEIKRVPSDHKKNQNIRIMCLGDNLINDKTVYYVKNKLTSLGVKAEMVGTMVNDQVYGEGRDGWFYSTFVGASGRGENDGKINAQTARGSSSVLLNPFIRTANADDKANNPNDCYRATGSYIEKSYYTDNDKNGAFYIFDFAKYMEVQGITTPDVVVIALKPELVNVFTEDVVGTNMKYMQQLITGIRDALPNSYIAIVPQYGSCTSYDKMWETTSEMIDETIAYVSRLQDNRIKVIPAWLHMNRELGTKFVVDTDNPQLYEEYASYLNNELSETAKIELANAITAFIMNI